jgi:hypothetical protein
LVIGASADPDDRAQTDQGEAERRASVEDGPTVGGVRTQTPGGPDLDREYELHTVIEAPKDVGAARAGSADAAR